jgi:hypothetical protein
VLPSKTPRDKDGNGMKVDGQRQAEQLDKELDDLPASASNATGNGVASASASNGRPTSSPSPNGSPRWAEYSDWQGYDYYDSHESCGIVGSMVLNAVSSSDEEGEEEQNEAKEAQREKPKATSDAPEPATQATQKAAGLKESESALAVDNNDAEAISEPTKEVSQTPSGLDVDKMRVPELKKALASKGLATTGRKAELVARLRGADVA